MMANNQHEDLVKFVSEAWSTLVDSRGAIFYKCNVPDQPPTPVPQNRNYMSSNSNSNSSSTNSSSTSGGGYNKAPSNMPFRQQ